MDSDQGKLFIGGISWATDEEKLTEYFQRYGEVLQTSVMRDKLSGKPRGFGFVVFADPDILDRVLQDRHVIDGRTVEAKRALSRDEQVSKVGNPGGARNSGGGGSIRTKKIFVGGLPPTLSEDGFRQYFEAYGMVTDVVIMYDQQTTRPRGFGFISFDSEEAVDRVLHKTFHDLDGKKVEVKRALPKDANVGGSARSMGGGTGGNRGGYQGYGSSVGNSSSYNDGMETKYSQLQNAGGGYPSYGSSGYNALGYVSGNGMGYSYGSYGGANPGYSGPAGGGYANLNAGYGSGQPNAPRSSRGSQAPTGYGYGSSLWGPAGRPGSGGAAIDRSSSGSTGYVNQGYGYGRYGGNDGGYGNQAAYGGVGGRPTGGPNGNTPTRDLQAGVGGRPTGGPNGNTPTRDLQAGAGSYLGGVYGDGSSNSGYAESGWQYNPSFIWPPWPRGDQGGYGGYGSASNRQAQQQ